MSQFPSQKTRYGNKHGHCVYVSVYVLRTGWDSNPRWSCDTGLTVQTFRPLKQPILFSSPYGIRTHILGLEDRCPVQLNEGTIFFVPLVGVEPTLFSELVSKTSASYQFRHKGI